MADRSRRKGQEDGKLGAARNSSNSSKRSGGGKQIEQQQERTGGNRKRNEIVQMGKNVVAENNNTKRKTTTLDRKKAAEKAEDDVNKKSKKREKEEKAAEKPKRPHSVIVEEEQQQQQQQENYYEDDFEEYESDFEEEEENAVQNGNAAGGERRKKEDGIAANEKAANIAHVEKSLLLQKLANNVNRTMAAETVPPSAAEFVGGTSMDFAVPELIIAANNDDGTGGGGSWTGGKQQNDDQQRLLLMDYFRELIGQNEHRMQDSVQTDGAGPRIGCQTDAPEMCTRGTQSGESGGRKNDAENMDGDGQQQQQREQRLGDFVRDAAQLIQGLLNMSPSLSTTVVANHQNPFGNDSQQSASVSSTPHQLRAFSSQFATISLNALFTVNRICAVSFKNAQTILLCVFVPNSNDLAQKRKSFVGEFALDPQQSDGQPERLYCCDSEVALLRYSPAGNLLFAAMKDGSLVLWDMEIGGGRRTNLEQRTPDLIAPSVNTAFTTILEHSTMTGNAGNNHWTDMCIVGMEVLEEEEQRENGVTIGLRRKLNMGGSSAHLARLMVLYESGMIRCWTAMDMSDSVRGSANEVDELGLGMRIKLVPENTQSSSSAAKSRMQSKYLEKFEFARCLALHNTGIGIIGGSLQTSAFVGTSKGRICRMDKTKGNDGNGGAYSVGSMCYQVDKDDGGYNNEITAVKFSKVEANIFAAATIDQRVFIFKLTDVEPIKVCCHSASAIASATNRPFLPAIIEWSPNSKLLYSIHSGGEQIVVWRGDDWTNKKIYEFYNEFRTRIQCSSQVFQCQTHSFMALGLLNGEVQVHCLN